MDAIQEQGIKRNVAYKFRIGDILAGKPLMENERLKHLEVSDKHVIRVNVIANIIEKYSQEGEKKFASVTLDDASGQIKLKLFGEDIKKFESFNQGDTVLVIGLVRFWNNEIYISPEIIKKREPSFLLVRKLECEIDKPKIPSKDEISVLKEKIISAVKDAEKSNGIDIEFLIMNLKEYPADTINQEIKKLLEGGIAYESRPGRLRYLG